ncbi:ABC-2 type transporter-domain-containing protein [Amylostereum chailletii]|nr:ABC-2 type transporter-domain-containing protein [Amylostereum chailletii]
MSDEHAPLGTVHEDITDAAAPQDIVSEQLIESPKSAHFSHTYPPAGSPPSAFKPYIHHQPGSSASHVNLDYFDPEGVEGLRRTLTRPSLDGQPSGSRPAQTSVAMSSESTLAGKVPTPFDFEKILREVFRKREESGIQSRELGVLFKDLRVVGLGATASYQDTFGSLFNPRNILESIRNARSPPVRDILSGFEGVVRPGEMLLVLGSPGSGCSTLLKTLSNQRKEYHAVFGDINYDGFSPEEIAKFHRGDVIYCPEDDVHFPTLKVQDTLSFAAKMRAPQNRITDMSRSDYVTEVTEVLETIFGLRHVKNTPVGDAAIRGVSGGEKKRVSISEALALRSLIGAWDNSTRGLDASTALEFVRALRIATDVTRLSTIVSIYQAGESLYEHFDKVCVIYEGRMAYFGRADRAKQYFMDLGFEPAHRQTTADFVVAVTDPSARIVREGFQGRTPRTAAEFAEAFLSPSLGKQNRADMELYETDYVQPLERKKRYRMSAHAEHAKTQPNKSAYTISIWMQARAVMLRRVQIIRGNMATEIIQMVTFILQAIINGTVFFNSPESTSAYFSRGGVLFFALLFAALSSMAEIPALFAQRPIVLKHYKAAMYHPFIEATALTLVDIPITFITLVLFSVVMYFLVGLQASAAQFFVFLLFVFTMAITMKAWFRALAAALGKPAPAQTVAGIVLLGLTLYTGYTIPKPSMIGALRWITYINPLRYGFEGLITNEFRTLNGTCASLAPSGPGYEGVSIANQVCTTVGSKPGQSTVDGNAFVFLSYGYSYSNTWKNFGIIVAFGVAFVAILLTFTELNTSSTTDSSAMLFKRGSRAAVLEGAQEETAGKDDEEKAPPKTPTSPVPGRGAAAEDEAALAQTEAMRDVFTWRHLQYDVPVGHGEMRRLLDDVSGFVAPGKLTALMGESGAGKTTLLNVLAQRQSTGVVAGERLVNGHPLPADFQAQTGYCQQMDTHLREMTVRESLLFSAKLRQPPSVSLAEKEAYVETVLKMCGLEAYGDAIVGSLGVEHRKRTTIGVELAAKPKLLLFLDEPTSGLDSQSAWAIVSFLRKLADHGQAILCTIHQPSAELFQVFDKILLLRKGGQTVYFGDIGYNATKLLGYFQDNGGYPCPADANPAEYILDVIGAGATATTSIDWHSKWKSSADAQAIDRELEQILDDGRKSRGVDATLTSEFSTSWLFQTQTLLRRELQRHWRDPTYLVAKFALNLAGALFIGFTFFKSKDTIQGTQNKIFAVFMSTILSAPLANQIQVPFLDTRKVYEIRERPSRMYSWTSLITAQMLGEIPFNIIGSSIYFLIWYWLVALPTDRAGYTYLMMGVVFPLYYTTFAQGVAAMSPNAEVAALLFSFLFSFVITLLSPYTYLIEGLIGQAVGRSSVTCAAAEVVELTPPSGQSCGNYMAQFIATAGGKVLNPDAVAPSQCQFCSVDTTDQFLFNSFNIDYNKHWRDFGLMFAYIMFNVAAVYGGTYLFRIYKGNPLASLMRLVSRRK